jgi:hypothetical protein
LLSRLIGKKKKKKTTENEIFFQFTCRGEEFKVVILRLSPITDSSIFCKNYPPYFKGCSGSFLIAKSQWNIIFKKRKESVEISLYRHILSLSDSIPSPFDVFLFHLGKGFSYKKEKLLTLTFSCRQQASDVVVIDFLGYPFALQGNQSPALERVEFYVECLFAFVFFIILSLFFFFGTA